MLFLTTHICSRKIPYHTWLRLTLKWMDDFQSFAVHISFSIEKSLYLQVQVEVDHLYIYQLVYQNLMKLLIVHIIVKELR